MRTPVKISLNGKIYYQSPFKHLMGRCPEKNTPKMTQEEFLLESKRIWGDRFDYKKTLYNGALKNIILIEKITGIEYVQRAKVHLEGSEPLKSSVEDFIFKSKQLYGDDYDYSLVNYRGNKSKVMVILRSTGEIFKQTPSNHLYYRPENINKRDTVSFVNDAGVVHDYKFTYDKTVYIKSNQKVIITCPIHGDFSQTPNSHLGGSGCLLCNESKGEKYIAKFLDRLGLNYSRQHKFKDCKNIYELPFDFYIPSLRMCIEFDGIQHYKQCDFFGGKSTFDKLKINDKIKTDYCEDNYINFIRIRYDKYDSIEEILNNNILPLKNILKR